MIVRKFVSSAGVGSWNYITFKLKEARHARGYTVVSSGSDLNTWVFLYTGTISSYVVTNNQFIIFSDRWLPRAGTTYPAHAYNPNLHFDIILPAGDYTFACYVITTGQANLVFSLFLDD